jgi:hypothetical protein
MHTLGAFIKTQTGTCSLPPKGSKILTIYFLHYES